jgi:hypothetical protein
MQHQDVVNAMVGESRRRWQPSKSDRMMIKRIGAVPYGRSRIVG